MHCVSLRLYFVCVCLFNCTWMGGKICNLYGVLDAVLVSDTVDVYVCSEGWCTLW